MGGGGHVVTVPLGGWGCPWGRGGGGGVRRVWRVHTRLSVCRCHATGDLWALDRRAPVRQRRDGVLPGVPQLRWGGAGGPWGPLDPEEGGGAVPGPAPVRGRHMEGAAGHARGHRCLVCDRVGLPPQRRVARPPRWGRGGGGGRGRDAGRGHRRGGGEGAYRDHAEAQRPVGRAMAGRLVAAQAPGLDADWTAGAVLLPQPLHRRPVRGPRGRRPPLRRALQRRVLRPGPAPPVRARPRPRPPPDPPDVLDRRPVADGPDGGAVCARPARSLSAAAQARRRVLRRSVPAPERARAGGRGFWGGPAGGAGASPTSLRPFGPPQRPLTLPLSTSPVSSPATLQSCTPPEPHPTLFGPRHRTAIQPSPP